MSNNAEPVGKYSHRVEILKKEDYVENFEKLKTMVKNNKKFENNSLVKTISFFIDKNIVLDIDVFWLDAFFQICDSKESIKKNHYYLLIVDLFKSSMLEAIRKARTIDYEARKSIIERLKKCGLESVIEENLETEEDETEKFDKRTKRRDVFQESEDGLCQ